MNPRAWRANANRAQERKIGMLKRADALTASG